jgi:hypothetical protein
VREELLRVGASLSLGRGEEIVAVSRGFVVLRRGVLDSEFRNTG